MRIFRKILLTLLSIVSLVIFVVASVLLLSRFQLAIFDGTPLTSLLSVASKHSESFPAPITALLPEDPCARVIQYSIGSIDSRFSLSREEFVSALREAANIWEAGIGTQRFSYVETGGMPVNLVFDDRQAGTDILKNVSSTIESGRGGYDELSASYAQLRSNLEAKKSAYEVSVAKFNKEQQTYDAAVTDYNRRVAKYEQEVAEWNANGGSEKDYNRLKKEKSDLDDDLARLKKEQKQLSKEADALNDDRKAINALVGDVNTVGGTLNRMANSLNIKVNEYNEVAGSRDEFTTGLYVNDASGERIDVFQFYDRDDLVKILAHEMGHALGLGHEEQPESIMYPSVGTQSLRLSDEDMQQYRKMCGDSL